MNAPTTFVASGQRAPVSSSATAMRWTALTDAGKVVAMLAGSEPEQQTQELRKFPALIRDCEDWRRELADNAVADIAAMMEPGLNALLAINARGADPRPAAQALWQEYRTAREAVLALLPPAGAMGPRRSA